MANRLLNSLQSRTLRWMLIVCLSGTAAGLIVPIVLGLVLPETVYQEASDGVFFWAIVAVAAALCALIAVRTRRKPPRPPR